MLDSSSNSSSTMSYNKVQHSFIYIYILILIVLYCKWGEGYFTRIVIGRTDDGALTTRENKRLFWSPDGSFRYLHYEESSPSNKPIFNTSAHTGGCVCVFSFIVEETSFIVVLWKTLPHKDLFHHQAFFPMPILKRGRSTPQFRLLCNSHDEPWKHVVGAGLKV